MTFQPTLHPKQTLALESYATEILYGGAAGGGKSYLLRVIAIMYCLSVPGVQVYILRRLSDDLKDNHLFGESGLLSLTAGIPGVKVNEQQGVVRFPNGAMIHLDHCQYEKDKFRYQGKEIHVLLIDELTHFTETQYRYIRGRVRRGEGLETDLLLPRIIAGANPGGVGHNWVRRLFLRSQKPYEVVRCAKEDGGMLRQFIPARLEDNPSLNTDEYEGQLHGLGDPALVKAMRYGDWNIVSGGMLDDIWNITTEHRIVLEPFRIPDRWVVNRSFDWGSSKPFSVGWWAISNGEEAVLRDGSTRSFYPGSMIRIHEWYGCAKGASNVGLKMLAKDIAKGIKERESFLARSGIRVTPGPADSSIYDTVNGMCIADDMKSEGVTWTKADKTPGSRVNGAELIRARLSASLTHPMEEPGLFTFNHCRDFIDLMPIMPRDEKKTDDVDTESEDHIWDETRYQVLMPKYEGGGAGRIGAV